MIDFGFEYFCGANVVVEIDGLPLLECSGLRCSINESKRPIYGYSSRHFDAVAQGQVLVEGALLINFVSDNYLFKAMQLGGGISPELPSPIASASDDLIDELADERNARLLTAKYVDDPVKNEAIAAALVSKYYGRPGKDLQTLQTDRNFNPHDLFGDVTIRVTFGNKDVYGFGAGATHYTIENVFFTGRGQSVQIDENVIVEEYPFFARNRYSQNSVYTLAYGALRNEPTITVVNTAQQQAATTRQNDIDWSTEAIKKEFGLK